MIVANSIAELRKHLAKVRKSDRKISLVPTMGSLHEGHLSLIREARSNSDFVVCSIFVNPTQFNDPEDYRKYPRSFGSDADKLREHKCDMIFAPARDEMYTGNEVIEIDFGNASRILEGEHRPGHFNGVAIVVAKLFNVVDPDVAFFGEKDLQQLFLIRQLVRDLNFKIEIESVKTERTEDGLALSSRNKHLTKEQRSEAPILYRSLSRAKDRLIEGAEVSKVKAEAIGVIESHDLKVEYFEIVELKGFQVIESYGDNEEVAICVAALCGQTRLIDNIVIKN